MGDPTTTSPNSEAGPAPRSLKARSWTSAVVPLVSPSTRIGDCVTSGSGRTQFLPPSREYSYPCTSAPLSSTLETSNSMTTEPSPGTTSPIGDVGEPTTISATSETGPNPTSLSARTCTRAVVPLIKPVTSRMNPASVTGGSNSTHVAPPSVEYS